MNLCMFSMLSDVVIIFRNTIYNLINLLVILIQAMN